MTLHTKCLPPASAAVARLANMPALNPPMQVETFERFGRMLQSHEAMALSPADKLHLLTKAPTDALSFRLWELDLAPYFDYVQGVDVPHLLGGESDLTDHALAIALAAPRQDDIDYILRWFPLFLSAYSTTTQRQIHKVLFTCPAAALFTALKSHTRAIVAACTIKQLNALSKFDCDIHYLSRPAKPAELCETDLYHFMTEVTQPIGGWAATRLGVDHFCTLLRSRSAFSAALHMDGNFGENLPPETHYVFAIKHAGQFGGILIDALSDIERQAIGERLLNERYFEGGLTAAIAAMRISHESEPTLARLAVLAADPEAIGSAVTTTKALTRLAQCLPSELLLEVMPYLPARLQRSAVDRTLQN